MGSVPHLMMGEKYLKLENLQADMIANAVKGTGGTMGNPYSLDFCPIAIIEIFMISPL